MGESSFLSFIICTYNRAQYLHDTLKSLAGGGALSHPVEILVVDNNSTDQTPQIVKKKQNSLHNSDVALRYLKETEQGLSHARNRGIAEARAPYIVFLDDDIRATSSLISAWLCFFADHPDAEAAGGKIHVQFDDPRPAWMSHFLLPLLGYHDLGNAIKKYPSNKYPFGGNMGFKKSLFEKVGLFDPELGRKGSSLNAGEEKELFNRIRAAGSGIWYLPEALLYHRVDAGRLTIPYIKEQALGLGQSMRLHLNHASGADKLTNGFSEIIKLLGSFPLGMMYVLQFEPSKAKLLFQFRRWIWEGYFNMEK